MVDMDVSDDLEEILFLLEDNVFDRWRMNFHFLNLNQNIYGRLYERVTNRLGDVRNMNLPAIKGPPNTDKLLKTGFYQLLRNATSSSSSMQHNTLSPIRRRRQQASLVHLLQQRERLTWHNPTQCYVNNIFLPNTKGYTLPTTDKMKYCSVYSPDNGRHLIVASGDGDVTVFNTEDRNRYREVARYFLDQTNYCPLDLDVTPDGREFLISTWRNNVYTCNVLEEDDIDRNYMRSHQLVETTTKMGTFSACFSNDGKEILAATTDGCIYVYDRTRDEPSLRIVQDLRDDINAARFLYEGDNNVIIGGSNHGVIEIWDRRVLGASVRSAKAARKSVATLFGHFDGITYIDAKGDGRHFITNSKDQSVKLWDVRQMGRRNQVTKAKKVLFNPTWNYQSDPIPDEFYGERKALDGDCSLMTYRGHRVAKTLIRAKFSPAVTTGNRYIYTGCASGRVIIYDTLTGKMIRSIEGHDSLVRDVSWHPSRPEIASGSFDETVNLNVYAEKLEAMVVEPLRRSKRIAAKRARDST